MSDIRLRISPFHGNISIVAERDGKALQGSEVHEAHVKMRGKAREAFALFLAAVEAADRLGQSVSDVSARLDGLDAYTDFRLLDALADASAVVTGASVTHAKARAYVRLSEDTLSLAVRYGGTDYAIDGKKNRLFGHEELWCALENKSGVVVCPVDITHAKALNDIRERTGADVPAHFLSRFLEAGYYDGGRLGRVRIEQGCRLQEVRPRPVPRIYLHEQDRGFTVELRFAYGEQETRGGEDAYVFSDGVVLRVVHDPGAESERDEQLRSFTRFDGESLLPMGDPMEWLSVTTKRLIGLGFEIYGRESLLGGQARDATARMAVSVGGTDWLDLRVEAEWEGVPTRLSELLEAVLNKERFVRLSDGTLGAIPPEWLERLSASIGLLEVHDNVLRASPEQLPIIEEVLAVADEQEMDARFSALQERLRSFSRIADANVPEGFTGVLRPYQKAGYDWLRFLDAHATGGILADDMGLGKTVQVLALLLWNKGERDLPALVVVPTSLVFNWVAEAKRFAPSLRMQVHHGPQRATRKERLTGDVIVTTYATLRNDRELFDALRFSYAVLDESQHIKNPHSQVSRACRRIHADHRLAMTGTPIENSSLELWSQFAFACPGLLGTERNFRLHYAHKIEEEPDGQRALALKRLIKPFLLRRTKQSVAPDLPEKQVMVVPCEMDGAQEELYKAAKAWVRADVEEAFAKDVDVQVRILKGLLRLRQLANHPSLLHEEYRGRSGKFDVLCERVLEAVAEGHKALVFSGFVGMLGLVERRLRRAGVRYAYLDGSTTDRAEQVRRFQDDPSVSVFLISIKAGGVGLTLTAADYVFIADPWWNPAVEAQAVDRAHRIGQKRPVFVFKLVSSGTVEEKIVALQDAKSALADSVVETEEGFAKRLTKDDLSFLLS